MGLPTSNSSPIPSSTSSPLPMQRLFSTKQRMGAPPHPLSNGNAMPPGGIQLPNGHQVVIIQPGGNSRAQWAKGGTGGVGGGTGGPFTAEGGGSLQGSGLSLTGRASLVQAGLLPPAAASQGDVAYTRISATGGSYHHHQHHQSSQHEDPFPLPGAGASGGLRTRFSLAGGGSDIEDDESESSDGYEGSQDGVTPRLNTRVSMSDGYGLGSLPPGGGTISTSHQQQLLQGGGTSSRRQSGVGEGAGNGVLKSALASAHGHQGRGSLSRQGSHVSMSGIDWTSGTAHGHHHHGSRQQHHHHDSSEEEGNGKSRAGGLLVGGGARGEGGAAPIQNRC
jgi:hypothetical protein